MDKNHQLLIDAVLAWWKYHEHETTGDCGEYNMYDYVPDFVEIAINNKNKDVDTDK